MPCPQVRADNRPTGEAFVDFENFEEAARAVREKDHKVFAAEKFGDRYVRLLQASRTAQGVQRHQQYASCIALLLPCVFCRAMHRFAVAERLLGGH